MKSIRLSLLLYFLALLAVALGAVSVLVYQYTQDILKAKVEARAELSKKQYDDDAKRERYRFDRMLGENAFRLMIQAREQDRNQRPVNEFDFHEQDFSSNSADGSTSAKPVTLFFQINSDTGKIWRSSSMEGRTFDFDSEAFKNMPTRRRPAPDEIERRPPPCEDTVLEPGLAVRLFRLKVPLGWHPRRPGPRSNGSDRLPPPPSLAAKPSGVPRSNAESRNLAASQEPRERATPVLYIQFAADKAPLNEKLAALRNNLENELANLREESRATLTSLRTRLLLIGLFAFAGTVAGGVWLVRLGLSPLQRLSQAVSQVSAKDFRLPFDEPRLPRELRPIVERLTETLELLKRTFAREKQATADISHELRTPLAALLTTTEVALRKPRSAEEYRELLEDCHTTGQQMSQAIERLLALARLDAGVDTLRPREVDVSNLADQCVTLVQPLVSARGLTLNMERNSPVHLHTDPDKLREVLTNLLHNAIEYNRPNGSIELALHRENGHVLLEVRDTGIGIAPEAREHIFERFYRADPSRQADGLHAGLGLAIVKGYVDLMGGQISVDSTEGQGTTFRLELPANKA
jgi:heavy metal sensor kinase